MKRLLVVLALTATTLDASVAGAADTKTTASAKPDYAAALSGAHRSEANRARDKYRHPAETLGFFGLKPTLTVVEVSPGGGWYTEVLAPLLANGGKLYAAHNNPAASERAAQAVATFKEKLAANHVYHSVEVTSFGKDHYDSLAPAGSADMVLTFRNVHNWYIGDFAPQAFGAFYKALKPGGMLGVVDHRLPEARPDEQMKSSGYMKTSTVIALAEGAGFKLAGKSEVNANPKDTADYPKGVWTLPPTFREGDVDKPKYEAIGESDRMTLKFVKPK